MKRQNNRGIVFVEALLIMSVMTVIGMVSKTRVMQQQIDGQEHEIQQCRELENYLKRMEEQKHDR